MGPLRLRRHFARHKSRRQYGLHPPSTEQSAEYLLILTPTDSYLAEKRYTFILKDELLPKDSTTGREQATISWECDFELPPQTTPGETHDRSVFIPWDSLNPTYRGKLKKDAEPLDTSRIKRMSIMMRRYEETDYPYF